MKQSIGLCLLLTTMVYNVLYPAELMPRIQHMGIQAVDPALSDYIVLAHSPQDSQKLWCLSEQGTWHLYDAENNVIIDQGEIPLNRPGENIFSVAAAVGSPASCNKLILGLKKATPVTADDELLVIYDAQQKAIERSVHLKLYGNIRRKPWLAKSRNTRVLLLGNVNSMIATPDNKIMVGVDDSSTDKKVVVYYGVYNANGTFVRKIQKYRDEKLLGFLPRKHDPSLYDLFISTHNDNAIEVRSNEQDSLISPDDLPQDNQCLKPGGYSVTFTHAGNIVVNSKTHAAFTLFNMMPAIDSSNAYLDHSDNRYQAFGQLIPISGKKYVSIAAGLLHRWEEQEQHEERKE